MNTQPQITDAGKILAKQSEQDEMLRRILSQHFEIPTNEDIEAKPDKIAYRAWALMAVEVGLAMSNMIIAMRKPESGRSFRAMQDLTYVLNSNDFWVKNAPILVPIITVMMNAHKDGAALKMEARNDGEYTIYDKLTSATSLVCLEIFSILLYLVGGPQLMGVQSLPLKIALAPYLIY